MKGVRNEFQNCFEEDCFSRSFLEADLKILRDKIQPEKKLYYFWFQEEFPERERAFGQISESVLSQRPNFFNFIKVSGPFRASLNGLLVLFFSRANIFFNLNAAVLSGVCESICWQDWVNLVLPRFDFSTLVDWRVTVMKRNCGLR